MEIKRKKFEVKLQQSKGKMENVIFIDGEPFDWSIDMDSYAKAVKMGPEYVKAAQTSIATHFLNSLSEMVGRKVTTEEINKAKITGWI
jgi:hypothetical protein